MTDKNSCPNCKDSILEKKITKVETGTKDETLPKIENNEYYWCSKCKEIFEEEDLDF